MNLRVSILAALELALAAVSLGAAERAIWRTSKVRGSPEPAAPYRIERAFPLLTFKAPLDLVTIPGTDRMVVVEHAGLLRSFTNDEHSAKIDLFADLKKFEAELTESYSLTFHPRFAENRFAFVWMNLNTRGKPTREDGTRIVRFRVTTDQPPVLDLANGTVVFTWPGGGHNGGNLRFGPDGMLYICTGDGAGPDPPDPLRTGQDIGDLLASVLRIDVDRPDPGKTYGIPKDNPFVTTARARGEVWAYGFRNPWRMSFDPKSGSLWVGDVGWELWEMIYRVTPGGNYGWSITEGSKQPVRPEQTVGPTPILPPVVAHPHEEAASITGGEFYRGKELPQLEGAYIYGDWQFGTFWALRADGERVTQHWELCRSSLAPVAFGITPNQELLVCDQTGGGLWRLVKNDRSHDPAAFPRRLSETGLFRDAAGEQPSDGVIPYEVRSERWADHATGKRWVGFPDNGVMTIAKRELGVMPAGRWVFPPDAVLAKTYSLEMERGNPATRRRVETQLLHFDGQQWAAYSYRWNDAQTDAQLVRAQGENATLLIKDPAAPGGSRRQTWRFFSRGECLRCHNLWNNFAPGFSPVQLEYSGPASHNEQLAFLLPAGYLPGEAKLVDPHAGEGRIEQRARSYLHANCATCHRYGGGGAVPSFMNIETALAESRLIDVGPAQGDLGLPDARIIAPGDPHRSVLLYRMTTGGRGHMPYLGSQLVDDRGILLLRAWINEITAQTAPNAALAGQNAAAEKALAGVMAGDEEQLDPLLQSSSGAFRTALALIDGSARGAIRDRVIVKGSALHDPLKRDLFERFLPDEERRKTLGKDFQRDALLARKGDRANGEQIFKSICANCHRAVAHGIDFGPELTRIAAKYDRRALLDQIIDPTKVLEPAWHPTIMTLKNGEAFTGFVVERSAEAVTIKLPTGEQKRIAAASIENISTSPLSLMPAGLIEALTESEAADLMEFVGSLK